MNYYKYKTILSVVTALILVSGCSLNQIDRRGLDKDSDILYQESLMRRSSSELKEMANNKNNHPYIRAISSCHLKINQNDTFLQLYQEHSDDPTYWISRGVCEQIHGQYPQAIYYYDIASQKKNIDNKLLSVIDNNTGVIALRKNNYASAQEYFKKSLQKRHTTSAKFNLGLVHLHFGHLKKADEIFGKLYELNSSDPDVIFAFAVTHTLKADYENAQILFDSLDSERLKRSDIAAYYALNLYQLGKAEQAYQALAHAEFTQIRSIRLVSDELKEIVSNHLEQQRAKSRE